MPRKQKGATPLADGNSLPTGKASKSNKAQTAGRISSRVRPSNANLGVVDEETRLAVKRARLEALEADNFVDNGVEPPGLEDDDFYVGDNEVITHVNECQFHTVRANCRGMSQVVLHVQQRVLPVPAPLISKLTFTCCCRLRERHQQFDRRPNHLQVHRSRSGAAEMSRLGLAAGP